MIDFSNTDLHSLEIPPKTIELNATQNQIQSLCFIPKSLVKLELPHNKIAIIDQINEDNFLKWLDLSYNRLISIEGLVNLKTLEILDLSYNFLSQNALKVLSSSKTLKILNVSHNHLQDIQALKVLNSLQSITELNISFNEFTTWSIESPMQNLKKLVIDNNKLKTFNLTKTSNLEYVSCVENSIKEIYGLTTLYNLQQLYADWNDLTELPNLSNLRILSVEHNRLSVLPNLPNLEVLNASYNCLISMPKAFFHVLELVLSHNSLTNLPNGMKNLEILDISYNKFEKLDFLTSSVNLKVLNACYNNFSNPELLLKKIKNCPLVEINLIGLSFSHKDVGNFFQAFQNLEKFNQKLISDENREAVFSDYSFDYKFDPGESEKLRKNDEIKQQPKKSLCLEIPDQSFLSKFSPNISVTSENKRNKFSYDKNLLSPETSVEFILPENKNLDRKNDFQNKYLTPSKTENFCFVPSKNTSNMSKKSTESQITDTEAYFFHKMKHMHRSIVKSVKKDISKKFFELSHKKTPLSKVSSNHLSNSSLKKVKIDPSLKDKNCVNLKLNTEVLKNTKKTSLTDREAFSLQNDTDRTSLFSYDNWAVSENELNLLLLIKYASMPSRPVLLTEANIPIINPLNCNTQEFALLSSLFKESSFKVRAVNKTFTFSLHKNGRFSDLMYFYGDDQELKEIFVNPKGFDIKEITLHRNIVGNFNFVLVCLSRLEDLRQVYKNTFQACNRRTVVPAYLVSYSNIF